ncbi:MAG: hypothetical protein Q4G09_01900 [Clostridia bacterium]|nr:hypothetical protein [Clostridia bacterium]
MVSFFSYLITISGVIFWIFRLIVATTYTMSINFGIMPLNITIEIVLLFITFLCLVLILKRNIIGALIYFVVYGLYFGTDLYNGIINIINGQTSVLDYTLLVISFIGVVIPFLSVIDIFFNKDRKQRNKNKKTDWFYKNKEYERKLDERADKNQYKF